MDIDKCKHRQDTNTMLIVIRTQIQTQRSHTGKRSRDLQTLVHTDLGTGTQRNKHIYICIHSEGNLYKLSLMHTERPSEIFYKEIRIIE